jgi:hypothetical protein
MSASSNAARALVAMKLLPEAVVDAQPIFRPRCQSKLLKILEMVTAPR